MSIAEAPITRNETPPAATVLGLHHLAYRCRDAEETRHFYEDILGLPLVHVVTQDHVPSTGERCDYVHIFFGLHDGSCVAFFDLGDDQASEPSRNTPFWVNHVALKLPNLEALNEMKQRLQAHGIEVLGVTDHTFAKSIYFFDPNGIRLEFTAQIATEEECREFAKEAHGALNAWTEAKRQARRSKVS